MREFGDVAIKATAIVKSDGCQPTEAWNEAVSAIFPYHKSLQDKSCPRCAFLGLCEDGLVVGIPAGSYTRSRDNKGYALKAVECLSVNPRLSDAGPDVLWKKVIAGQKKTHNSQMDVVITLWKNGLIARRNFVE